MTTLNQLARLPAPRTQRGRAAGLMGGCPVHPGIGNCCVTVHLNRVRPGFVEDEPGGLNPFDELEGIRVDRGRLPDTIDRKRSRQNSVARQTNLLHPDAQAVSRRGHDTSRGDPLHVRLGDSLGEHPQAPTARLQKTEESVELTEGVSVWLVVTAVLDLSVLDTPDLLADDCAIGTRQHQLEGRVPEVCLDRGRGHAERLVRVADELDQPEIVDVADPDSRNLHSVSGHRKQCCSEVSHCSNRRRDLRTRIPEVERPAEFQIPLLLQKEAHPIRHYRPPLKWRRRLAVYYARWPGKAGKCAGGHSPDLCPPAVPSCGPAMSITRSWSD